MKTCPLCQSPRCARAWSPETQCRVDLHLAWITDERERMLWRPIVASQIAASEEWTERLQREWIDRWLFGDERPVEPLRVSLGPPRLPAPVRPTFASKR